MSEISVKEIKSMTKEQNYMRGYKDGKLDILDKISAEIESLPTYCAKFQDGEVAMHIDKNNVLKIINKYETNI